MAHRAICECGWRGRYRTPLAAAEEAFDHEVFHYVEESTRAQGLPFHVRDSIAVRNIAILLGRPTDGSN